jgi:hypothetical protein
MHIKKESTNALQALFIRKEKKDSAYDLESTLWLRIIP